MSLPFHTNHSDHSGTVHSCPHLGMPDDEQTLLAFPSEWNYCYHCKPIGPVTLEHQRSYCLVPNHQNCIVYLRTEKEPLPHELCIKRPVYPPVRNSLAKIGLSFILVAVLAALGWHLTSQPVVEVGPVFEQARLLTLPVPVSPPPSFATIASPMPSSTSSSSLIEPVLNATLSPIQVPTEVNIFYTSPPPAEATATITRIPNEIDNLIGINYVFRIHRVRQGENLEMLARSNGTTVAAIFAVNYKFSAPLWVDQVVIIPVNQTDVSALPSFEAYRVSEDTSVESLATELGVDPEKLQYYNGIGFSLHVMTGEWLVIPREVKTSN